MRLFTRVYSTCACASYYRVLGESLFAGLDYWIEIPLFGEILSIRHCPRQLLGLPLLCRTPCCASSSIHVHILRPQVEEQTTPTHACTDISVEGQGHATVQKRYPIDELQRSSLAPDSSVNESTPVTLRHGVSPSAVV